MSDPQGPARACVARAAQSLAFLDSFFVSFYFYLHPHPPPTPHPLLWSPSNPLDSFPSYPVPDRCFDRHQKNNNKTTEQERKPAHVREISLTREVFAFKPPSVFPSPRFLSAFLVRFRRLAGTLSVEFHSCVDGDDTGNAELSRSPEVWVYVCVCGTKSQTQSDIYPRGYGCVRTCSLTH